MPIGARGAFVVAGIFLAAVGVVGTAGAAALVIDAPPALEAAARRIRGVNLTRLEADLARAGLSLPTALDVTLVADNDPRAARVPRWIVGLADGERNIVIFPQRVLPYPHDSVESVFRHEVAHLALSARAGGRRLPRWFHEGVAMSVDTGWHLSGRLRLLFEVARSPGIDDVARLFESSSEPDTALAYGLSAALVADVRRRHGSGAPGAIAARVAAGADFAGAFLIETGESPDEAALHAWRAYRRWTTWIVAFSDGSAVWMGIVVVSAAAFVVVRRRRAERRRRWDEEEAEVNE